MKFSFKKTYLNLSSAKHLPFCADLSMLNIPCRWLKWKTRWRYANWKKDAADATPPATADKPAESPPPPDPREDSPVPASPQDEPGQSPSPEPQAPSPQNEAASKLRASPEEEDDPNDNPPGGKDLGNV